jgi:hypothetical protein
VTREDLERIRARTRAVRRHHTDRLSLHFHAVAAVLGPWPACRLAMERASRREYARLVAADDQHDAAIRDAPLSWLTPHEIWMRG